MGNKTSTGAQKGEKVVASKVNMASKTGVLNLSEQDLKLKSSIWMQLEDDQFRTKLKSLDISKNSLVSIPAQVQALVKLKTLIITFCELTSLVDLRQFEMLIDLQASHNFLGNGSLEGFPRAIERCDLSFNRFVAIPLELATLSNLRELNLNGNAIESLDGIGACLVLTHLYLDENQIREVPIEIGQLAKLKLLSLKDNRIEKNAVSRQGQSLPAVLFTDTALDHIDLHGNTGLRKADVINFEGIDAFMQRRLKTKDKAFQGGGLVDLSMFGIE
jgi:Leucine-rich repeat (LRR) protein